MGGVSVTSSHVMRILKNLPPGWVVGRWARYDDTDSLYSRNGIDNNALCSDKYGVATWNGKTWGIYTYEFDEDLETVRADPNDYPSLEAALAAARLLP